MKFFKTICRNRIILEIKYKEKPVWNNNQNQVIPTQEKIQQKKFRIATKMPFELDFRASNIKVFIFLMVWFDKKFKDDYFIEYTIKNTSATQLTFHKIEFRTLDFYFSKKIVIIFNIHFTFSKKLFHNELNKESGMLNSDLMALGGEDIRKYLFFVEIKPEFKENETGSFKKKQVNFA